MTTTFEKALVSDRVWAFKYGWGTIEAIDHSITYSLEVIFDIGDVQQAFALDGKYHTTDPFASLFWDEIKFEVPVMPKRMVKKNFSIYAAVINKVGELGEGRYYTREECEYFINNAAFKCYIGIAEIKCEIEVEE